jgi:ubiquinone/menaquinone biosynthesis C-methylase UbiE
MKTMMPNGGPSALPGGLPDAPVPYAFERVQRDSGGQEVARLEAQNLLLEKFDPLTQVPPTPRDGTILDVGSGTGFWSQRLAARVPEGRIVCLDRSQELLELVGHRLAGAGTARVEFLHQDLRELDLPERAFDLIFTCVTLVHVQELEGALGHLVPALKPGGWLACFEPMLQTRRFTELYPPCPNLDFLMDRLLEVVQERGSDLSVSLKLAHHLERMGLEDVALKDFGAALRGPDATGCLRDVFLPLARAYLRQRWEPELLERRLEAAAQEASQPHLWVDFRRVAVVARRPG